MSKRNTQLRRHTIVKLVNEQGEVSVEALFSVCNIRSDYSQRLSFSLKNGQLLRRYGGAIALPKEVMHDEVNEKFQFERFIWLKLQRN